MPDDAKDPERKMWCAVERHQVQNQRRLHILNAVKDLRELLPQHKFYGNAQEGNVYTNNVAVLKTDLDAKATQAPGRFDHVDLAHWCGHCRGSDKDKGHGEGGGSLASNVRFARAWRD